MLALICKKPNHSHQAAALRYELDGPDFSLAGTNMYSSMRDLLPHGESIMSYY